MDAKDALAGETAEEKMVNYIERVKTARNVEDFLRRSEEATALLPAAGFHAVQKQGTPVDFNGGQQTKVVEEPELSFASTRMARKAADELLATPAFKGWDGSPQHLETILRNGGPQLMKTDNIVPLLKTAVAFQTPMPIDMVAQPYPVAMNVLDFLSIRTEPGSQIFYHQPPVFQFGTVDSRANERDRSDPIQESELAWVLVRQNKESIGTYAPIARENVNDNPNVLPNAIDQMAIDIRARLLAQIISGNGTSPQWEGMIAEYSGTTAGQEQTFAVPGTNNEPVFIIETYIATLYARGMMPTAIFCTLADWAKIRSSQRNQYQGGFDYHRFPMGQVVGVPLVPSGFIPTNNLLLGNWEPGTFEVVLGSDYEVSMSDEYRFRNNEIAMRAVLYGNCAYKRPNGAIKLTATNLFTAQV